MNELMRHLEAYHTNRLGFLRDKRRKLQMGAYSESNTEQFWMNKGKLHILNELITIEESLVSHDSGVTEVTP